MRQAMLSMLFVSCLIGCGGAEEVLIGEGAPCGAGGTAGSAGAPGEDAGLTCNPPGSSYPCKCENGGTGTIFCDETGHASACVACSDPATGCPYGGPHLTVEVMFGGVMNSKIVVGGGVALSYVAACELTVKRARFILSGTERGPGVGNDVIVGSKGTRYFREIGVIDVEAGQPHVLLGTIELPAALQPMALTSGTLELTGAAVLQPGEHALQFDASWDVAEDAPGEFKTLRAHYYSVAQQEFELGDVTYKNGQPVPLEAIEYIESWGSFVLEPNL